LKFFGRRPDRLPPSVCARLERLRCFGVEQQTTVRSAFVSMLLEPRMWL
jgi:hypothetical protein